jgi:hypothetical protein
VFIPWFKNRKPVYLEFCKLWSSPEFNVKSEKKRLNRGNNPKHRYGADGHIRKRQRMVRLRAQVLYTFLFSFDYLLTIDRAGWSCKKWYWDIHREPPRTQFFKNTDQLCSQLATYALVDFYHFLILSTVLSLTCISIVSARWCDAMERGSTGERQASTRWLCTLAEGKRAMDGESLILFQSRVFAMLWYIFM